MGHRDLSMENAAPDPALARLLEEGDLASAADLLRRRLAGGGARADDRLLLADLLWRDYRFDEAAALFEALRPGLPAHRPAAIAQGYFQAGRLAAAEQWLREALRRDAGDQASRVTLAEILIRRERAGEGLALALESLTHRPDSPAAARAAAHALRVLGRAGEAQALLEEHLGNHPAGPATWRVHHELATLHDLHGDAARAMASLAATRRCFQTTAEPLLAAWRARATRREALARALTRDTLLRWREECPLTGRVAILAGHPRSGTTLLERMLAAHPDVVTTDETGILRREFMEPLVFGAETAAAALEELEAFTPADVATGRAFYLRATDATTGMPRAPGGLLVEKDPLATLDLPLMLRLLPGAPVIYPLRHPGDIAVSCYFTFIPLGIESATALTWQATLEHLSLSLRLWQHWKAILPQPWCETRYEDLVTRPEPVLRAILTTCGLPWDENVARFHRQPPTRDVRTPSHEAVRQAPHTRAIHRWHRYERWLAPHLKEIQSLATLAGYE